MLVVHLAVCQVVLERDHLCHVQQHVAVDVVPDAQMHQLLKQLEDVLADVLERVLAVVDVPVRLSHNLRVEDVVGVDLHVIHRAPVRVRKRVVHIVRIAALIYVVTIVARAAIMYAVQDVKDAMAVLLEVVKHV